MHGLLQSPCLCVLEDVKECCTTVQHGPNITRVHAQGANTCVECHPKKQIVLHRYILRHPRTPNPALSYFSAVGAAAVAVRAYPRESLQLGPPRHPCARPEEEGTYHSLPFQVIRCQGHVALLLHEPEPARMWTYLHACFYVVSVRILGKCMCLTIRM